MEMLLSHLRVERTLSTIVRFGLDLAKNTFSICGVDAAGRVVLRKMVSCSQQRRMPAERFTALTQSGFERHERRSSAYWSLTGVWPISIEVMVQPTGKGPCACRLHSPSSAA